MSCSFSWRNEILSRLFIFSRSAEVDNERCASGLRARLISRPQSNKSDLDLNGRQSRRTVALTVWYLHIWKLHLYTRGDLAWLSRCWLWSASPCLWYLWLEGGDRPWHLGDAATLASGALLLETADLAAPSTTDWSSLSLLLAGRHTHTKKKRQDTN